MKHIINEGERVLVFKNEKLIDYIKEGSYRTSNLSNKKYLKYSCEGIFETDKNIDVLLKNEKLREEIEVQDVKEDEILIYYRDGIFQGGFYEGKHAFWRVVGRNSFARIDLKTAFEMDEKIKNVFAKTKLSDMFDIVEIADYNIALYYKSGVYEKVLTSGTCAASKKYYRNTFQKVDLREAIIYDEVMEKIFDSDPEFIHDFDIKKVREKELLLWYQDGLFKGHCLVGSYLFWNKMKDNYFEIVDLNTGIEIDEKYFGILDRMDGVYSKFEIKDYEAGLLLIDNQYRKTLKSGIYCFWNGSQKIEVYPVDLRIKQLDMQGEEILTKDRAMLRFNFIAQYRVVDPITNYKEINNLENQIYILIQMALREYVATQNLEQLLGNRHEIGEYVLEKVKKEERKYGIELLDSGIKDIISSDSTSGIINVNTIREEQNKIAEEVKGKSLIIIPDEPVVFTEEPVEETVEAVEEQIESNDILPDNEELSEPEEEKSVQRMEEDEYIEKIAEKVAEKMEKNENSNILEELSRILAKKYN